LFSVLERLTPRLVYRIKTNRPLVALSFDDGPHPTYTPQVLEILEKHHAKATFFLIGERAIRHPDLVARIKAAGHEVGNHYFANGSTLGHSDAEFLAYLDRTETAIGLAEPLKLFRPPGGVAWPRHLQLAQERGYTCVLGSAYAWDPTRPPAAYIRWAITKDLGSGAIVVLHDSGGNRSNTVEALPGILEAGRAKGLRFVTVSDLMSAPRP
jgi:peptidoglycan/xylan/chitin deacetylase (PgdA/CDA1 family)